MNCSLICRLFLLAGALALGVSPALAQPKAAPKKPVEKPVAKPTEPATVEAATKVLDLRVIPMLPGAQVGGRQTLAILMYRAKATPKAAFEFQRQQLQKLGFKEQPGGYSDAMNQSGTFVKEGFKVRASASAISGDPKFEGWVDISLVNDGNLELSKLPVPAGVKPFYPNAMEASYTTDAKVADAAAECRKLLIAAGWEPYGQTDDGSMQYFKRNAIKLMSWVSTTPAEGGKTLIRYSAELLQADLPAPPEIADPRYTDFQKRLSFDAPLDQTDAILAFYQQQLPKQGWAATTEKPVTDDEKKTKFLVFRNPQKEILWLDLREFTDRVSVDLRHQTAAELAADEKLAKEQAERKKEELARQNRKIELSLPLPAGAEKLEQDADNLFEFTLPSGGGPAALTALRDHLVKAGWTADKDSKLDKNTGNIDLRQDEVRIGLSYFDTGLTGAEIRVSGPKNVVFKPIASKEKPPVDPSKTVKKPKPAIPGIPDLPEGVEIPDDVRNLLEKALKDAEGAKPKPPIKKPLPKK